MRDNMNFPFSVAMCVYCKDHPGHFKTAVDSIVHQTVPPSEIVLVVDGPVTGALDAVIGYCEAMPNFHAIRLPQNVGHGQARRVGLAACKHEYVAIMDADDISEPDRFQKQVAYFLENPEADIVGGNITEFIDSPDNIVAQRTVPCTDDEIKSYMKKRCPMNLVTVMFKKSCINEVGGFIDWYCEEDYYLWLRMALADMKFANVADILVNVRVGEAMYQRRGGIRYFRSEAKLQRYMLKNRVIGLPTYLVNVGKRFIVQVLLPNRLRGWVFQKLAREKYVGKEI